MLMSHLRTNVCYKCNATTTRTRTDMMSDWKVLFHPTLYSIDQKKNIHTDNSVAYYILATPTPKTLPVRKKTTKKINNQTGT